MKTVYNVKEAQQGLSRIISLAESGRIATITRHDKTVAYVLGAKQLTGLLETMEILADPKAMQAIREAREGKGTYLSLAELPD